MPAAFPSLRSATPTRRVVLALLVGAGCRTGSAPPPTVDASEPGALEAAPEAPAPAEPEVAAPEPVTVRLAAVGDVLPHRLVKATAAARGWDFVFEEVAPSLRAADLAFANLESPIAPIAHRGIHGEVFNAPADLADGLAAAGIDVVSFANNHSFDQGPAGILETLGHLERVGIDAVGAGPTCEAAARPVIREVRGVRIAWLAAADLLNLDERDGPDAPCVFVAGEPCVGDCGPDRDALHYRADAEVLLAAVRGIEADFVILSMHWGDEYRTEPLPEYPALAERLIEGGVDVILGHHPHVLQPVRRIRTATREGVVAFSLGNFVSNMGASYVPGQSPDRRGNTRDGAILHLELTRGEDGATRVGEVAVEAVWTDNQPSRGDEPPIVRPVPHGALLGDPDGRALVELRRPVIEGILGEGRLAPAVADR